NVFLFRYIDNGGMPGLPGCPGDHFPCNARDGSLARGIHVGDEGDIAGRQRAAKLLSEVACTRVEMRLKECGEPSIRIHLPCGSERRRNLSGMVSIVVDDEDAVALTLRLESTDHAGKLRDRPRNCRERDR